MQRINETSSTVKIGPSDFTTNCIMRFVKEHISIRDADANIDLAGLVHIEIDSDAV